MVERLASLSCLRELRVFVMDMLCMSPYHDRYFCQALKEVGVDVTLASISFHLDSGYFRRNHLKNDPGLLDVVARIGVTSTGLRQALKLIEFCVNLLAFSIRFLFLRPDVIHVQWVPLAAYIPVELWFLKFARKLGVRLVYSVHNVLPHDTGDKFKEKFRAVYSTMDALICHTDASRERLVSELGQDPARVWVIPPGPWFHDSTGATAEKAREALALRDDECLALFFGSIAPYKGLDFMLGAWSLALRQAKTPARLMIVGPADTRMASQLQQQVEALCLQESVMLNLTFVPTDLLVSYHEAADILVYPYKAITHSAAVLTGITFGKPIIATALTAFVEIFENEVSALLVPYGNSDALAAAFVRLIDDPGERDRLAKGVTSRLQAMNSWRDTARKTEEVYNRVLGLPELGTTTRSRIVPCS